MGLARSGDRGREAWSRSIPTEAIFRLVHLHEFDRWRGWHETTNYCLRACGLQFNGFEIVKFFLTPSFYNRKLASYNWSDKPGRKEKTTHDRIKRKTQAA